MNRFPLKSLFSLSFLPAEPTFALEDPSFHLSGVTRVSNFFSHFLHTMSRFLLQWFLILSLVFASDFVNVDPTTGDTVATPVKKRGFTKEEIEERAREADKRIRFIQPAQFVNFIQQDHAFVFFGAQWCPHCKKLSPR